MNSSFKKIIADKITFWNFFLSLFLVIISIVYASIMYTRLPPVLPIYNRMPWGYQRLGERIEIFIPISLVSIFFIANILLTTYIYNKLPLIARLISVSTFTISLCASIFVIKVITLVL